MYEKSVGLSSITNSKPKGNTIPLPTQANLTQQKAV